MQQTSTTATNADATNRIDFNPNRFMPTPSSRRQAWQDAMFMLQCLAVLSQNNPRCPFKRAARLVTNRVPSDTDSQWQIIG